MAVNWENIKKKVSEAGYANKVTIIPASRKICIDLWDTPRCEASDIAAFIENFFMDNDYGVVDYDYRVVENGELSCIELYDIK